MKFLLLLLTSIAIVTSSRAKFVHVNDNSIVIEKENGGHIVISKQYGPSRHNVIEIDIKGPNGFSKKINITDESDIKFSHNNQASSTTKSNKISTSDEENEDMSRSKRSKISTTPKIYSFAQVMNDYQSVTDEDAFKSLLKNVKKFVEKGELDSTILHYLRYLSQLKSWSSPPQSEFEYPNQILKREKAGNYWKVYPYLKQNLVMSKVWSKLPTRKWYEQNILPNDYSSQNDLNRMKIKEKLWNEEMPTNYRNFVPGSSDQLISVDSTNTDSEATNWLGGKYLENNGRIDDKLEWRRYP